MVEDGKILDMHGRKVEKEEQIIPTHVVPALRLFHPTEPIPPEHIWKMAFTVALGKQEIIGENVHNHPIVDQGTTFILSGSNAKEMADRLRDEVENFLDEIISPPKIQTDMTAGMLDKILPDGLKGDKGGS